MFKLATGFGRPCCLPGLWSQRVKQTSRVILLRLFFSSSWEQGPERRGGLIDGWRQLADRGILIEMFIVLEHLEACGFTGCVAAKVASNISQAVEGLHAWRRTTNLSGLHSALYRWLCRFISQLMRVETNRQCSRSWNWTTAASANNLFIMRALWTQVDNKKNLLYPHQNSIMKLHRTCGPWPLLPTPNQTCCALLVRALWWRCLGFFFFVFFVMEQQWS